MLCALLVCFYWPLLFFAFNVTVLLIRAPDNAQLRVYYALI